MSKQCKAVSMVAALLVAMTAGACGQMAMLQGRRAIKEAHTLYQRQDYRAAAVKYEEAIKADPAQVIAYFYLGNSYDNLYSTAKRGQPDNDQWLTKAIDNYKSAVEKETDPKIRTLALQYLVAAYGPEKLNDPSQAEPVLQRMIQNDPNDPANYFVLAGIYENDGSYDQAEALLLKAKEVRPNDSTVYMQLAGYYNRQGEFDKTIEALQERAQREPNNPEAHYTIASYYWDKAYRDFRLSDAVKRDYVSKGLSEVDRAIQIKSDYVEAVVYKGLLLRLQANMEKDAGRQKDLLRQADALQEQAKALQKKRAAGV